MPKRVKVTKETNSGRNATFQDNFTGDEMSRAEFVSKIKTGEYGNYHVRKINGVDTPVSNPDARRNNNLD